MKLLFFSATLKGGGAERVLANIVNELVKRGHDITISLNINESNYEVDSRVKIVCAPQHKWYKGGNLIKRLFRNIAMRRCFNKHTGKVIKELHPDVIITFLHCNMMAIIRQHGNIPIIHSEHNAYDRKLGVNITFMRFFLNRFFDKVFVLTSFDQGFALAKGLKNTVVMPNPNTFSRISKEEYDSLYSQRKNILVCGRIQFWYVKGMDIAIEAFAKVAEKFPDVDLDIAGSGGEATINQLKKLAKNYNVEDRVHFLGYRNDINNLMKQHKIFLLSSRTEGFPMVITEAMSQGLPCVAFERLASSIILDGIDGCLVKNGDTNAMAEAIEYMFAKESTCRSFGVEGLNNVERFSVEKIADMWEKQLMF